MFRNTNHEADIVLGLPLSDYPGRLVRLSPAEQRSHALLVGRSGSGKSRLMRSMVLQKLAKGDGVCLIDPHSDLAVETMAHLTTAGYFRRSDAFDRLVYVDWGHPGYVLPFNVLAANRPPHTVALNALDAAYRAWPELRHGATMFQTLFLSSVMTLIANNLPLTAIHQLLSDEDFRAICLAKVTDPLVIQTFERFGKLRGQAQESGSLIRRAFLLSFSELARLSLGQPDLTLDFRRLMDNGVSVIVNLGTIGDPETRRLIGALLLVQIEQAALSRTDLAPARRRPYTVFVDEWPSFAASSESQIRECLEQTRKYGLTLYLACQSIAQVSSERLQGALESCGLNVSFGLGRSSAVEQSRQIAGGRSQTEEANLLSWIFPRADALATSMRQEHDLLARELQLLNPQEAYVKIGNNVPVKIKTLDVPDPTPVRTELAEVMATYKTTYQRSRVEAERRIAGMTPAKTLPPAKEPFTLFGSRSA